MKSALLNGDEKTGVSIMRMVKEMDAGPVFAQRQFPLDPDMKYPELEKHCAEMGAEMLLDIIKNFDSMSPQEQDHDRASHCSKISKQDGQVDWTKDSATDLYNKLRAFTPWPGIFTTWKDQKLSLLDFNPISCPKDVTPHPAGTVFQSGEKVLIECTEGAIVLKEVQLAGKKPADMKSFLNGYPDFLGAQL